MHKIVPHARFVIAFIAITTLLASVVTNRPVQAQGTASTLTSTTLTGTVQSNGTSLAGVSLELVGPTKMTTTSGNDGSFSFSNVESGLYVLTASKAGYTTISRVDITVSGTPVSVQVAMTASSFGSLREIGNVTTRAGASGTINTSTAAVEVISASTFLNQGQDQVINVLNETPGIITTISPFNNGSNGAAKSTPQVPQIRGALPYETASLIDGHPVGVGVGGYFSPLYLNPYILQDVEVVKGPGAMIPDINYAIGGSVNYRTLEPTTHPNFAFDIGMDNYGGVSSNYRATGTTLNGKLGYALDFLTDGTPGPLSGNSGWYGTAGNIFTSPATINGQVVCGSPPAGAVCPSGAGAGPKNVQASYSLSNPLLFCCAGLTTQFNNRSELAKLRFNFSPETSLMVSYLGAQAFSDYDGRFAFADDNNTFTPNAAYVPCAACPQPGIITPYVEYLYYPNYNQVSDGLFQAEFRTTFGQNTLLARYYSGADNSFLYNVPVGSTYNYTAQAYGSIYLGNSATPTIFTGQTVSVSEPNAGFYTDSVDHFRGESIESSFPSGDNLYTISYDRVLHDADVFHYYDPGVGTPSGFTIPPSASEGFGTLMARGIWQIGRSVQVILGNYFINYTTHYTPDGGKTWTDASHSFYGPRLAMTWRPTQDLSWRASAGSSIAPPYLSLVNTPSTAPNGNNAGAATFYTQKANSGNVLPETAFGYDFGGDLRLRDRIIISGDLYQTILQNQYLTEEYQNGTYTPTGGPNAGRTEPLYIQTTANLGHSQYAGAELGIHRDVQQGFGFVLNGALIRAYPYDLPAGFYNLPNGKNKTNLAIFPYVNFQPSGNGYNGLSYGRVPYAQGYAEANITVSRLRAALGVTYYGSNNPYNQPAFGIMNGSLIYQLNDRMKISLTGWNLTNTYGSSTYNLTGGIPVALENGKVGWAAAVNVGPATYNLSYHIQTGQ